MTKKLKVQAEKSYNLPTKNRVRETIVNNILNKEIKTILTLESSEFLFSKLLPNKKIFVFEKNIEIYKKMEKCAPKNVTLFFGNISKFAELNLNVDCIYFDFCSTFQKNQDVLIDLKKQIKNCKLFIVSFYRIWRGNKKYSIPCINGGYEFDLINKIQTLTEVNWKVLYGERYNNSMVTIIFENQEVELE